MFLEKIKDPKDLKTLSIAQLQTLSGELREQILASVSQNGGHLASNLGAVELTVAFHKVFSSPEDKLIMDVGHQSYAHKLLTGRKEGFLRLRKEGGVSGFTKRGESQHDPFGSGHSGNAVSAAMGFALAEKLNQSANHTVALVGDGAFTNGMTYEALNNCAGKDLKLILVLNDNEMAISRNVGTIDNIFTRLRTSRRYFRFKNCFVRVVSSLPFAGKFLVSAFKHIKDFLKRLVLKNNFFETMGFDYYGPVDGNDIEKLIYVFKQAKRSKKVCVIHAYTKKGKGYAFAEEKPDAYHSVSSFCLEKGIAENSASKTFSRLAGEVLVKQAETDVKICAVTAAMTSGTGLSGFATAFPCRFFDVGIAEEHAATFCAGLSAAGMNPVFAVYSTFLQRAFDQVLEDAAMQGLKLTLLLDRAGLVGDDGVTHHGIYDVSLLNKIPGVRIYSPETFLELDSSIQKALSEDAVSAVRYPKGAEFPYDRSAFIDMGDFTYADFGKGKIEKVIVTYGRLTAEAVGAATLAQNVRVIKLIKLKPIHFQGLSSLIGNLPVLFAEEGVKKGGIGESFAVLCNNPVVIKAIDEVFPQHGALPGLYKTLSLDAESLYRELTAL